MLFVCKIMSKKDPNFYWQSFVSSHHSNKLFRVKWQIYPEQEETIQMWQILARRSWNITCFETLKQFHCIFISIKVLKRENPPLYWGTGEYKHNNKKPHIFQGSDIQICILLWLKE